MTEFMRKTYIVNLNKYTLKKHNLKQAFYANYVPSMFVKLYKFTIYGEEE